jgi:hypothetical protein
MLHLHMTRQEKFWVCGHDHVRMHIEETRTMKRTLEFLHAHILSCKAWSGASGAFGLTKFRNVSSAVGAKGERRRKALYLSVWTCECHAGALVFDYFAFHC